MARDIAEGYKEGNADQIAVRWLEYLVQLDKGKGNCNSLSNKQPGGLLSHKCVERNTDFKKLLKSHFNKSKKIVLFFFEDI